MTQHWTERADEIERIRREYDPFVQAAGLKTFGAQADESPEAYRLSLMHVLQHALPPSTARALRADAAALQTNEPEAFAKIERHVKAATIQAAREGNELRPVYETDRSGRQSVSYYGPKSQWMGMFRDKPRLMTALGDVPYGQGV